MNVESFSQLPFIRPTPYKEKGIRLFGIEFGSSTESTVVTDESDTVDANVYDGAKDNENGGESGSSRKFECHYCCRNFPTSQALGGHQNAHKRERQNAKRAHLVHNSISDAHLYGLVNYRPSTAITYPSWNHGSSASTGRYYGGHGPTINGSPLALWRIPAVQSTPLFNRDRSTHPLPLFAGEELRVPQVGSSSTSSSRYVYESKSSVHDHVSLDLHL